MRRTKLFLKLKTTVNMVDACYFCIYNDFSLFWLFMQIRMQEIIVQNIISTNVQSENLDPF